MDPLTGSIITAVAPSLIGGLFGKKKSDKGPNLTALKYQALAAGFNPLTALQNGGTGPWMQQASGNDFDVGSMASNIAGAINDYWTRDQESELLDAEIDLKKAQTQSLQNAAPGQRAVRDLSSGAAYGGSVAVSQRAQKYGKGPIGTRQPGLPQDPAAPNVDRIAATRVAGPGLEDDRTVYNERGEPLEAETFLFGSAMDGELATDAQTLLNKNYPRIGKVVQGSADFLKSSFDATEKVIDKFPGQVVSSLTPRLMTEEEKQQLSEESWMYRNLGFDIDLIPAGN